MESNLPPIWDSENLKEDVEKHEAHEEKTELNFKRCKHKQAKIVGDELKCGCGAGWSGPRIHELHKLLTK